MNIMKTVLLTLFCMAPAVGAGAADYHLTLTQLRGAPTSGTPPELPVFYVLLWPRENGTTRALIYQSFGSKDMELDLHALVGHGDIPSGSVLHYDPQPDLARPTEEQIQALKDFCKKPGIFFKFFSTSISGLARNGDLWGL
jgi:hypothetical protein